LARKLSNGFYVLNCPGKCPDGYYPDPSDPLICIPDVPCVHRKLKIFDNPCCVGVMREHCDHFEKFITLGDCVECAQRTV
jgi:hypothetical protein